jgi:HEAT repeat protein
MLRAAAAPERFLTRGGLVRFLAELGRGQRKSSSPVELGVALPKDVGRLLTILGATSLGGFTPRPALPALGPLVAGAKRGGVGLARLTALLAGAVPFGETRDKEVVVCFLEHAPVRGLVATLSTTRAGRVTAHLHCRSVAELALMCSLHAIDEIAPPATFGVAEEESVRALVDRARERAAVLVGSDARLKSAARDLALRPLDVPPPTGSGKGAERTVPLAFGPLVDAFFRAAPDLDTAFAAHLGSNDALVGELASVLTAGLHPARGASVLVRDLARRRDVALRAQRKKARATSPTGSPTPTLESAKRRTARIVAHFDALPPNAESYAALHEREETLLALREVGHASAVPSLVARALTGDAGAVEMLGAFGDRSLVPLLLDGGLLAGGPSRARAYETAVVRMVIAAGARSEATAALRRLLADNPLTNWRAGLERGALVRELVVALGELEDQEAAPLLLSILEAKSQEYRSILPYAAGALGRLRHVPALAELERLLTSPKEPVSCEAVWAVGAIGEAHPSLRESTAVILDRLKGLEPGAEVTRLAAIAKVRDRTRSSSAVLRRAIDRALWEPAYRQEDTSRRRGWALRALEEAALMTRSEARLEPSAFFLGHDAIRHLATRDDHRVRRAAERAFAAWGLPVPDVRRYYAFALPALEEQGGFDALLEAVRDPLGVFRHNVASRLRAIGDPRAVRPLTEATARLFAEPPTSTYEYDDAPPHLVAFVRALAKLNRPEGNDVLIEGLRSENHQVRAVVAENAPDDERFVPELMAMLGDSRSFLRSRAEKSLTSLGALPRAKIDTTTTEIAAARPRRMAAPGRAGD